MKTTILTFVLLVSAVSLMLLTGSIGKTDDATELEMTPAYHADKQFNDYWYNGEAELTHFEIQQARYGEIHSGNAVMIFVAEHISPKTLLKGYNRDGNDIPSLKLNFNTRFFTGIYPYSLFLSAFTPTNLDINKESMKVTFSSQEWCGHTYSELQHNGRGYEGMIHSYFPDEGNKTVTLSRVMLEDEVWNRIRIDHETLPTGNIEMLPSMQFLRLKHRELKPYKAMAALGSVDGNDQLLRYTLRYSNLQRILQITFEKEFPHRITGWEETIESGYGSNAQQLTTTAVADESMMLDYWNRNSVSDSVFRKELGIY